MIRQRRNLALVGGADPAQFNSVRMFRVVSKVAPSASPVVLTPVIGDFPTDAITLPPGDSGWLPAGKGWSAIRLSCATSCSIDLWWLDSEEDLARMPHDMAAGGASSPELLAGPGGWDAGLAESVTTKAKVLAVLNVAAGAALDTGILDTSSFSRLSIVMFNAGAGARAVTCNRYAADGVTGVYLAQALSAGPVGTSLVNQGDHVVVAGIGGALLDPLALSPKMQWTVAAGGVGAFTMGIWGR